MSFARSLLTRRTLVYVAGSTAVLAGAGTYYLSSSGPPLPHAWKPQPTPWAPPPRRSMVKDLQNKEFDLLVVGGGATGAGIALDAASRGFSVALVEREDFSSGTSSKSTKLVHGGVRYLQKAVMELDYQQYKLVKEALHERKVFLETAPHLSSMLPLMLPIYQWWKVPYYWAGCKMYDLLAGKENVHSSYLLTRRKALEIFPMLKDDGLVGALVYYDGQHNDSRMNISLVMSAVQHGATVANYSCVTSLNAENSTIHGARIRDMFTGEEYNVKAKGVINATGPLSDTLLTLADPDHKPIVQPSSGTHVVLPSYFAPTNPRMGLLDPATRDGRVLFVLPWEGGVVAGTTDEAVTVPVPVQDGKVLLSDVKGGNSWAGQSLIEPKEEEIQWILNELRKYVREDVEVRREDVMSTWTGLRPLVRDPHKAGTQGLVRSHVIHVGNEGLLTVAGGKWTTYREMAEEAVDQAIKSFNLTINPQTSNPKALGCVTEHLPLIGADGWSPNMWIGLIQKYNLPSDVAKHLASNYGDRAWQICEVELVKGKKNQPWKRLDERWPYLESEVRYALTNEYALTPDDVLARRTRLSFLDAKAAARAFPRVVEIMAEELGEVKKVKKPSFFGQVMRWAGHNKEPKMNTVAVERSGGGV